MTPPYHVDKGLQVLIKQWKEKHPKATVGTIAGGSHRQEGGHWPDQDNSVDAADFMAGPDVTPTDLDKLCKDLVASKDRRIAYIIRRNRITSSTVNPWISRLYRGKYHNHCHVEVNDKHAEDTTPWVFGKRVVAMEAISGKVPILKIGMSDPVDNSGWHHIMRVQRLLGVTVDGDYGPKTASELQQWLKERGLPGNGKTVNAAIYKALAGIRM